MSGPAQPFHDRAHHNRAALELARACLDAEQRRYTSGRKSGARMCRVAITRTVLGAVLSTAPIHTAQRRHCSYAHWTTSTDTTSTDASTVRSFPAAAVAARLMLSKALLMTSMKIARPSLMAAVRACMMVSVSPLVTTPTCSGATVAAMHGSCRPAPVLMPYPRARRAYVDPCKVPRFTDRPHAVMSDAPANCQLRWPSCCIIKFICTFSIATIIHCMHVHVYTCTYISGQKQTSAQVETQKRNSISRSALCLT